MSSLNICDVIRLSNITALSIPKISKVFSTCSGIIDPLHCVDLDVIFILSEVRFCWLGTFNITIFNNYIVFISDLVPWLLWIMWVISLQLFLRCNILEQLIMLFLPLFRLLCARSTYIICVHAVTQKLVRSLLRSGPFNICDRHAVTDELRRRGLLDFIVR